MWKVVRAKGAKIHFCPPDMIDMLTRDLEVRDLGPVEEVRDTEKPAFLDVGGPALFARKFIQFETANLEIPAIDYDLVRRQVFKAERRYMWNGSAYYKLHSKWSCVVLSDFLHTKLLVEIRKNGDEFYALMKEEEELYNAAVDELNRNNVAELTKRGIE